MPRYDSRDLAEALASGGLTFAWYALPDAVASRRARGVAKALLLVPLVAIGARQNARLEAAEPVRTGVLETATPPGDAPEPDDAAPPADAAQRGPGDAPAPPAPDPAPQVRLADVLPTDPAKRAALVGVGLGLVAGSVWATVAGERALHRLGQRMAARGTRLPHTRIGLVSGALAAAMTLATARLGEGSTTSSSARDARA